jgi:hypothetical protein
MAMERVTIENNGERFTVEVPEGTSDADVLAFVQQQQGGGVTAPEPQLSDTAVAQAGMAAVRPTAGIVASQAGDAAKLARIAGQVTPNIVGEFLSTPITSAKNLTSAYLAGHPMAGQALNTPLKAMPGALMRGLGAAVAAPESAFLMPYNMAAYEQEKIRANPNAPGLQSNPYAQTVRGEAATQNRAGAANQMRTVANMPYGNVSAQERAMLDEDARMKNAIRKKAFEKVMGPVVPGSF